MATTFYRCNPELNKECRKTACQKECILTTHEKYALRDEFGRPIVAECENKGFIEAMRTDLMKLPYTYKGFPSDRTKYIKRDDVMKIFEKYTEGESKDAHSN